MNVHTVQPHPYSPDYQAMGDCRTCGHLEDSPLHRLPDKQGARALAERLFPYVPNMEGAPDSSALIRREMAANLLGESGLFIADVSKHEPVAAYGTNVSCICGWSAADAERGESYFDHIGAAQ